MMYTMSSRRSPAKGLATWPTARIVGDELNIQKRKKSTRIIPKHTLYKGGGARAMLALDGVDSCEVINQDAHRTGLHCNQDAYQAADDCSSWTGLVQAGLDAWSLLSGRS